MFVGAIMDLFPVSWSYADHGDDTSEFLITVFGKTLDGTLTSVHIEFFPYFFVPVPDNWGVGQLRFFIAEAAQKHGALQNYSRPVKKKSLWGFRNGSSISMVQLAFPSHKQMKWAARDMKKQQQIFESGVDPLLRFFHIQDILPASWIRVQGATPVQEKITRAPVELRVRFHQVGPSDVTSPPPLVLASYDLEVYSKSRKFPKSCNVEDAIIQAAVTYQRYGETEPYATKVFCLKDTAPVEGIDIHSFQEEHDLLNAFFDDLGRESADVLLGYNTNQFDAAYILGRAVVLVDNATGDSAVRMSKLGRLIHGGGEAKAWSLTSSAFGQNSFEVFQTPGMLQMDLLQVLRRETKHDSYSLNSVAKFYLGDQKIDLPAHEIFDHYDGSATDRGIIAGYAAKDTVLPLRLTTKLCVLENLLEMANATYCPADYIQNRGQQIRVFSVLLRKARLLGFACPDGVGIGVKGKFEGATVLEANEGAYFKPVACLDFSSRKSHGSPLVC